MSRARQQHETPPKREGRGKAPWIFLIVLFFLAAGVFVTATILVAKASEAPEFREHVAARLAQKLGADVELGPIQSHALVFLSVPEVKIRPHDQQWAISLQRVTLELDWRLLLQREWTFRSVQVQEAQLSLGMDTASASPGAGGAAALDTAVPASIAELGPLQELPSWVQTLLFRGRSGTWIGSIRIGRLDIRGPSMTASGPIFEIISGAEGRYVQDKLEWRLHDGTFQPGGQVPWKIKSLAGGVERGAWTVHSGLLQVGSGELNLTEAPSAPGEIAATVSASNLGIETLTGGEAPPAGPVDDLAIGFDGIIRTRFPEVHRFRFDGALRGEQFKLSACRLFEVLAGQTGESRLAHLRSETIKGRIEWTPDLVRLYDLQFGEPGLVQLEGRLSVVASAIAGVFDLELPVALVGKFPSGKPQGFSYPASGWSRAQLRIQGPSSAWTEDLTRRLLAQVPPGIPVGPAARIQSAMPPTGTQLAAIIQERNAKLEALFEEFVRREGP